MHWKRLFLIVAVFAWPIEGTNRQATASQVDSVFEKIDRLLTSVRESSAPSIKSFDELLTAVQKLEVEDMKPLVSRLGNSSASHTYLLMTIVLFNESSRFQNYSADHWNAFARELASEMGRNQRLRMNVLHNALWHRQMLHLMLPNNRIPNREAKNEGEKLAFTIVYLANESKDEDIEYRPYNDLKRCIVATLLSYDFRVDEWLGKGSSFSEYVRSSRFTLGSDGVYRVSIEGEKGFNLVDLANQKGGELPLPPKPVIPSPELDRDLRLLIERLEPLID
jgi:hypothetical protein